MDIKKNYAIRIIITLILLLAFGVVVLVERSGVLVTEQYDTIEEPVAFTEQLDNTENCLMITDNSDELADSIVKEMKIVLDGMKVKYSVFDARDINFNEDLYKYDIIVIGVYNWDVIGENFKMISEWINDGGCMMNIATPNPTGTFYAMKAKLGIADGGNEYTGIKGLKILNQCMIGSNEQNVYMFTDGEEVFTSLNISLDSECERYVDSDDGIVPVIWGKKCGNGKIVVINDSIAEKFQRGFLCLAYSKLKNVCIYPVIDASSYYIDDFPSPVPGGDGQYIMRDYGLDTSSFYSTVWFSKILEWEKKYGIKHTGVIIEEYSDQVSGEFERNTNTSQFLTFGNTLINNGGELGLHGYNHMPLCLTGLDELKKYGSYKLWKSEEDMINALKELNSFASELFPGRKFTVYVPPSNIMSEYGRSTLLKACPDIKVIASTYLKDADGKAYEQEFGIGEDGVINAPRITSGCFIDEFQKLTAFSELNFQMVQCHFLHPDDTLDEDRGAEKGWAAMSDSLESYINWINKSAPQIRNMTGTQMGYAVKRYSELDINTVINDDDIDVNIGGFSSEAYFLLRINDGRSPKSEDAEIQKAAEGLYLVHTNSDHIHIMLED